MTRFVPSPSNGLKKKNRIASIEELKLVIDRETLEKSSILFKFKEGEIFNRRKTWSILRIKLKLHCVQNVEPNTEIGQKGAFCKGLSLVVS